MQKCLKKHSNYNVSLNILTYSQAEISQGRMYPVVIYYPWMGQKGIFTELLSY